MAQQRRRIIVEGFQTRFVATEVAWLAVCFALFVAVLTGPLVWQINTGSASASDLTGAMTLLQFHDRIWIPLLALFLGVTWTLVRLSHRVAGPLYRFRQVFTQVSAGDLSVRVRVREHDYLVREGEEFDRMIGAVRDRVRQSQESAAALTRDLAALSGKTAPLQAREIARLVTRAEETEDILAGFVVGPAGLEQPAAAAMVPAPSRGELSLARTLVLAGVFLCALAALAVPAYTAALAHARGIRTSGHRTTAATTPPSTDIASRGRQ